MKIETRWKGTWTLNIKGMFYAKSRRDAWNLCWNIKDFLFTAGDDTFIYKILTHRTIYGFDD